jgi:mRNA interferase MazF
MARRPAKRCDCERVPCARSGAVASPVSCRRPVALPPSLLWCRPPLGVRCVSFDPVRGSEAAKTRPAVVVSNDAANATATRLGRGVITVVPVTSNTARIYPFQVFLPARQTGLQRDSKAQAEQVRSVAVERIGERLGQLPAALIAELDSALRVHLSL